MLHGIIAPTRGRRGGCVILVFVALNAWCAVVVGMSAVALGLFLRAWLADPGMGWWRPLAFCTGLALAVATVASPLDAWGADGLLAAHVAQHLALGDLAAPLLLLGLPPAWQRWLRSGLLRLGRSRSGWARLATAALSPIGALVLWTTAAYVWLAPPVHLWATPAGFVHLVDHLSFLALGLVFWLGAFDPRPTRDIRAALRAGGLPWWGRHVYAMASRLTMMPLAIGIWLASASSYHDPGRPWTFSVSPADDQELAASVKIGFEMLLFSLAIVLAFIFLSVSEGRQRSQGEEA